MVPIRESSKTKKGNNTEADWSSEGPGRFLVCPRRTEQINTSPLALIHPIADNNNSRKLTLKIVQPYTLGPGRKGTLPRSRTSGAGILIHRRIKIRSRFPRKRHTGSPSMYYA